MIGFTKFTQFENNLIFKISENHNATAKDGQPPSALEQNSNYYDGFSDCIKEVFRCLTNVEAMDLEQPCFQRLMGHLQGELHFVSENAEGSGSDDNHKDTQNNKCPSATSNSSNGSISSLPSSKTSRDSWRRKRTHENNENSSIQKGTSKEKSAAKRPHVDSDKNSSSDGNGSSTSSATVSSSSKKEKIKVSPCTGCTWDGNGGANSNTGSSSGGSEKEKEVLSSSLKQDTSNMFDKADMDGGQCGPDGTSVNFKWPNHGLDIPIHATPISPRTPYIPNPYTVPTYALHPSGTHYIPVVLHTSFPFPDMNGRLNSAPNGYIAALNYMYMKMGNLQFPYFPPSFPFIPPVNGITGLNGVYNPKHEPVQKQYEPKPSDVNDSTNIGHEHSSTNECTTSDLLSEQC